MAHVGPRGYPVLYERDFRLYGWNGHRYAKQYLITAIPLGIGTLTAGWVGSSLESDVGVADYVNYRIDWTFHPPAGADPTTSMRFRYQIFSHGASFTHTMAFLQGGTVLAQRTADNNTSAGNFITVGGFMIKSPGTPEFSRLDFLGCPVKPW